MATTGILQPDGTRCYTGPTCRKHGVHNQKHHATELLAKVEVLLPDNPPEASTEQTPPWWDKYSAQDYQRAKNTFTLFGANPDHITPITWHKLADRQNYIQVDTGDPNTQLIAKVEHEPRQSSSEPKYTIRTWLYKNQKPVAMLKVSTFPTDFTYPEEYAPDEWTPESVINTVEVHPDHTGRGHALEIIRTVEKNLLAGRLIHSGGSYTPEGRAALGGKLPYTKQAIRDLATRRRMAELFPDTERDTGPIPEASFSSMRFVGDWDTLYPDTISTDDD